MFPLQMQQIIISKIFHLFKYSIDYQSNSGILAYNFLKDVQNIE